MLSNKSSIEIVNNKYRIIFSNKNEGIKPFVKKCYWDNEEYK